LPSPEIRTAQSGRSAIDSLPLDDPEFYPLVATDFEGTAPTIAISADVDPLRDDARLYVEKLPAAGISAQWINEPGLVLDYLRARHVSTVAGAAFARIGNAIKDLAT
jgi:acetyl esterase